MSYKVKIDIYKMPLSRIWYDTGEWCKAGDVAHLCSIMAQMYRALDKLAGSERISDAELKVVNSALERAHEVMP